METYPRVSQQRRNPESRFHDAHQASAVNGTGRARGITSLSDGRYCERRIVELHLWTPSFYGSSFALQYTYRNSLPPVALPALFLRP